MGPDHALVEFTARFVAETGAAAPKEAFAFGDDPSQADELARLVIAGPKRATTALLDDLRSSGEQLPVPRDTAAVLDGRCRPVCVIRTSWVEVRTLDKVDPSYAWDEGEGDRSLRAWRQEHDRILAGAAKTSACRSTPTSRSSWNASTSSGCPIREVRLEKDVNSFDRTTTTAARPGMVVGSSTGAAAMSERPSTRALGALLLAVVFFPLLTMVAVLSLRIGQALPVIIVGVAGLALLTAWATSRQPAPDRVGQNSTTHPQPTTDEVSGPCTRTD